MKQLPGGRAFLVSMAVTMSLGLGPGGSVAPVAAAPPDAPVTLSDDGAHLFASGTTLFVGTPAVGETFRATFDATGLGAVDSLSCGALDGFSVTPDAANVRCDYTALGSGSPAGQVVTTLRDGGEAAIATGTFQVTRDLQGPSGAFSVPGQGLAVTAATSVDVTWTAADAGAGLAPHSLQHQVQPNTKATCSLDATNEGAATTAASPVHVSGLADERCHRWVVSLADRVGNQSTLVSDWLVTDRTPPHALGGLTALSGPITEDLDTEHRGPWLWIATPAAGDQFKVSYYDAHAGWPVLSVSCPQVPGFTVPATASTDPDHPTEIPCLYTATGSGYESGDFSGTATDAHDQVGTTSTFGIRIDTTPPDVHFTQPSPGLVPTNGDFVVLDWVTSDAGAGLKHGSARLQREYGSRVHVGSCDDVDWDNEGLASANDHPPKYPTDLADGSCYRWIRTVDDVLGNRGRDQAGPFLIDRTNPTATLTLSSAAPGIAVGGATVRLSRPVAGETFSAQVTFEDGGSGMAEVTCPDIPGFDKMRTGSDPSITCTWTATGAGYLTGRRTIHVPDRAGNDAARVLQVVSPEPALDPLGAPFRTQDIGTVRPRGVAGRIRDTDLFFSKGAGSGFSGKADSFRFAWLRGTESLVRLGLEDQAAPNGKGLVGLMAREDLTPGARFVFIGRRADGAIVTIHRATRGKAAVTRVVTRGPIAVPIMFRIRRAGNRFSLQAQTGGDAGPWTRAVTITMPLPKTLYNGIAITSRSPGSPSTAIWR